MTKFTRQPLPNLQLLLLDLISPIRIVTQAQVDVLGTEDWSTLIELIRSQRLGALTHWQLQHNHKHLHLPVSVKTQLAQLFKRASMRNLKLQRELLLVHQLLDLADIPNVPLKGACLAFHVYPHVGLRSMRDLDILVPKDQALRAYQVLLAAGLSRIDGEGGVPAAAMQIYHHMPPIKSPTGDVIVELHQRLFHPSKLEQQNYDLSESADFWERLVPTALAGKVLMMESPTDLLFHLIVHAVYDHELSNGPLLLPDIAYLLEHRVIEWSLFWQLAHERQMTRGCLLALHLTQRYWGQLSIDWPDPEQANNAVPDDHLEQQLNAAAFLMTRDFRDRLAERILMEASFAARVGLLLHKAFPTRSVMAAKFPVSSNSVFVFAWYPVNWWRLLRKRMPGYWRSKRQNRLSNDFDKLTALRMWLKAGN